MDISPDQIHQMAFEEGQPADTGDGYLFTVEEFDLFVDRLLTAAAPVSHAGWEPDFKSDENALEIFSKLMAHKLAKKAKEGRSGWQECSQHDLTQMLREHVAKGDPVDVANFCMMLSANGFRIGQTAMGGEPQVFAWLVSDIGGDTYFAFDKQTPADRPLVDMAHVTRLQAVNAALQARLTAADQKVDDLQSELTKARELNAELEKTDECWLAVIQYMLGEGYSEEPMEFLRVWNQGDFDILRREWPDAPEAIYLADPLSAKGDE